MSKYKYHPDGTKPTGKEIFVFGSNLAGVHGAGAAREAFQNFGAVWGCGRGGKGQSYALPTKDANIESLTLRAIFDHVTDFLEVASLSLHRDFFITRIGCGLAGYKDEEIAPMFYGATSNCNFPEEWKQYLE